MLAAGMTLLAFGGLLFQAVLHRNRRRADSRTKVG
jgi:hypothetical protein